MGRDLDIINLMTNHRDDPAKELKAFLKLFPILQNHGKDRSYRALMEINGEQITQLQDSSI
jgi:hypothetical protein